MASVKKKPFPLPGQGRTSTSSEQSRSVFHAKLPTQLDKEHDDCLTAMANYTQLMQQFCGAGSHVASAFVALLKDTAFAEIAGQFQVMMAKVESLGTASGQQANADIERLWSQLSRTDDNKVPSAESSDSTELSAQGLKSFLQMQCQFFQMTTDLLRRMATNPNQDHNISQLKSPRSGESNQSVTAARKSAAPSPKHSESTKGATTAVNSPNSLRKQVSSFFKLGSKSNSTATDGPTPAQSLFYVDLGSEVDGVPSAGQRAPPETLANAVSGISLQPGAEAAHPDTPVYPTNGQIATQEELDSVIDFLSRGPRQPVAMEAIPENQPPIMSRAVGSQLTNSQVGYTPQPHTVGVAMPMVPPRAQSQYQHRLSDGLLADSLARDSRTNTWPIKPSQRHTFGQELAQMMQMYGGVYDNLPMAGEADYNQYVYSLKQMKQPGPELLPGNQAGVWSPGGDMGLQRMWQYSSFPADRTDGAPRQWSTAADSSSCSDESSSNGEVPWMIGHDLVTTVNKGRRHSSAEEIMLPEPVAPPPVKRSSTLDSKTTNTWPPKQIWGNRQTADGTGLNTEQTVTSEPQQQKALLTQSPHQPLTPQWSDPIMNKSLSVWDPGLSGGASQPSLPTHPVEGATLAPRPVPPPRQRQHDRKY